MEWTHGTHSEAPIRAALSWILRSVCPGLFFVAGVSKLASLDAFVVSLQSWSVLPDSLSGVVGPVIALAEVCLGAAWFLHPAAAWTNRLCLTMLLVYTAAFATESLYSRPPECNCLGLIADWMTHDAVIHRTIPRNTIVIVAFVIGLALRPKTNHKAVAGTAPQPVRTSRRRPSYSKPGFTIIEMLVTVGVLAVLVGLVIPAASQIRAQARRAGALTSTKQFVSTFLAYSNDYKDVFPFLLNTEPYSNPGIQLPTAPPTICRVDSHFTQSFMWSALLKDTYLDGRCDGPDFQLYSSNNTHTCWPSLLYSCSMLASPEFWNLNTRVGPEQWRPVRAGQVRFPSAKVILFENYADDERVYIGAYTYLAVDRRPIVMGLVDGSARYVRPDQFGQSCFGLGTWPGYPLLTTRSTLPVNFTLDGVRGRDIID